MVAISRQQNVFQAHEITLYLLLTIGVWPGRREVLQLPFPPSVSRPRFLMYGLHNVQISKLQCVQNETLRLKINIPKQLHIMPDWFLYLPWSATIMIKNFSSDLFFLPIFNACLFDTAKSLASNFTQRLFPLSASLGFHGHHCSHSKLIDWALEGWIKDKMMSKTH